LILIGVFIGKWYFGGRGPREDRSVPMSRQPFQTAEQIALNERTHHYLQRSKVLLLGLINFDPETEDPYTLNLPQQKQISQRLVQEAGYLKDELSDHTDKQLLRLINDLEVILLQIANLESEQGLLAVEMVKSGVDRRGILLKINLEEMRRTAQQNEHSLRIQG